MTTSAENRKRYTYLSDMEITKVSDDTLAIELKNRTVEIGYETEICSVCIDMSDFRNLCKSDDVSLSESERGDLLEMMEIVAAED